ISMGALMSRKLALPSFGQKADRVRAQRARQRPLDDGHLEPAHRAGRAREVALERGAEAVRGPRRRFRAGPGDGRQTAEIIREAEPAREVADVAGGEPRAIERASHLVPSVEILIEDALAAVALPRRRAAQRPEIPEPVLQRDRQEEPPARADDARQLGEPRVGPAREVPAP